MNANLALVTLNIAPEYSPVMFGKLINEPSSATYNHILTALSGAKRIEALMEGDNKIIASLNYWQGLFMLRHSPSIAWHPQDHARTQGSSFWWYAQNRNFRYAQAWDPEEEKTVWNKADTFAYGFLTAEVSLPLPPWAGRC